MLLSSPRSQKESLDFHVCSVAGCSTTLLQRPSRGEMGWSGRVNGYERPLCRVPDLVLMSTTRSLLAPAGKPSLLGVFSLGSQLNSRNPIALPGVAFSHLEGRMERRAESWADEKSQSRNAREQCRNDFGLVFQS